jgi:hypothetical protein
MKLDDLAIPIMLIFVGALRVVPQLIVGGPWGAESTVAAVFMALGVVMFLAEVLRPAHEATLP